MEELKEMEKRSNAMDIFLEMIAESENAPIDFKILNEDKKSRKILSEIMTNRKFIQLSDESDEKKALYAFMKQITQFLSDLKARID